MDVIRRSAGCDGIRRLAAAKVIGGTLRVMERRLRAGDTTLVVQGASRRESGWHALYCLEIEPASGLTRELSSLDAWD